jgi:hypothetical protein
MGFTLLVYCLQLTTGLLFRWARRQSVPSPNAEVALELPSPEIPGPEIPGPEVSEQDATVLEQSRPQRVGLSWGKRWAPRLRALHWSLGWLLVSLVLLLLSIGVVGTLGHFGALGQSVHLWAGSTVVLLVLASAGSSRLIGRRPWGRSLHLSLNGGLLLALAWVSWSGWSVVQKYLP